MNFNNILVGITLLISLITLYTIYNVNNNMDKLLLDTDSDSDDLVGNAQRLSIIKSTRENNIKLNQLEGMAGKHQAGIRINHRRVKFNERPQYCQFYGPKKNPNAYCKWYSQDEGKN